MIMVKNLRVKGMDENQINQYLPLFCRGSRPPAAVGNPENAVGPPKSPVNCVRLFGDRPNPPKNCADVKARHKLMTKQANVEFV